MTECPFLTTYEEKIFCFDECVFSSWSENGECPFKNHTIKSPHKKGVGFNYDGIDVDELEDEELN